MTGMDLIWLFFIFSALQPVMQRRMLEYQRARKIAKLQQERKSRVILMVHRQETMSFLGFPLVRYIDVHDSEQVLQAIHMTDPDTPIDMVLHTPGGLVLAAVQIARALKDHRGKVTVFVPHYAMSGGTLISLAADEIVMSPHAVLGPVDPQLGQQAAASILKAVEQKPIDKVDDETLILADVSEKAIRQVERTVNELLEGRMTKQKAAALARKMATGQWTHDYPISAEEASELGLNVSTDIPRDVMEMMQLYPQPTRQQGGGVEYLPVPVKRNNKQG